MSNRRSRSRRRGNKIFGISNKVFYPVLICLIIVITACALIMRQMNIKESKRIAEEKERINAEVEEIYASTNAEIQSISEYKTNSIIRISAVGDILCGNNLYKYGKSYNSIFKDISKYLKDTDLNLGTYETDIKEDKAEFAKSVKEAGINFVSLAHNHALDYGEDGLKETKEYLESIKMQTTGIDAETPEERVKIVEIKKTKIAILSYTYDNGKKGVTIYSDETAKNDLEYANKNAAFSIVMMHWGNVNTNTVSSKQKEQAKFLIENGADIIIGAHPSAVQEMEMIQNAEGKDCFVAYSLGDFTSDFTNEISNLELILNLQIFVDTEGNASIYKINYTPVYMYDNGSKLTENRFKILDMKYEIAKYDTQESNINKATYEKLVKGIDKLKTIIEK